jgi:hypothetical protein
VKRVNVNLVCVAYRGYSESEGEPTEAGIKLDALAIADYVQNNPKIDKSRLFVIGRSLGGCVALYLLKERPRLFQGAVIENTFTSFADISTKMFTVLRWLPFLTKLIIKI